jgi:hypothetical protein
MAVVRRVPRYKLAQIYPEFANEILKTDEDDTGKLQDYATPFMSYENNLENKLGKIIHTRCKNY